MGSITSIAAGATLELKMLKAAMGQPAAVAQLIESAAVPAAPAPVVSGQDAAAMLAAAMEQLTSRSAAQALMALEANQPQLPQVTSD